MSNEWIPVAGPWITDLEVEYAADAARNGWQARAGEWQARFEAAFAELTGVEHAVALPSCTSALHLALAGLGVGSGDEVIVPDLTWIATAAPVTYLGAKPVFADCNRETWCISPESFETCVTARTRAVIAVDLYGSMPDYSGLYSVADELGIKVIEDAAEGLGSIFNGRRAGSLGQAGTFSFHGSKTLTTGEGGMLVTDDADLAARVRFLADHGRVPGDVSFQNVEVAYKYKMSPVQAALGLAQTERAAELVAKKREIFSWYAERLAGVEGVVLNAEPEGVTNSYWMVTTIFSSDLKANKFDIREEMNARNIDTRPFFSPLSSLKAFRRRKTAREARGRNRVSYDIAGRGLNLPSGLMLTESDVDRVCAELKDVLAGLRDKGNP